MKKISMIEREITFSNEYLTIWADRTWVLIFCKPALKKGTNTAKMTRADVALVIVIGVMLNVRDG